MIDKSAAVNSAVSPLATRERFIVAALVLFAERGYYGVSMDQIGREVGLTKQALIHHFGTKARLYAEVMDEISAPLIALVEGEPEHTFADSICAIHRHCDQDGAAARVLVRELLDNQHRAAEAEKWFLKPLIDKLSEQLALLDGWSEAAATDRVARVYQLLGAINYFVVSGATLSAMYSAEVYQQMRLTFERQLRQLASAPPAQDL